MSVIEATKPTISTDVDTTTLVTFLLDSTQSMQHIKSETLEAFNTYVEGLKRGSTKMDFTLVTFNRSEIKKVHFEKPIADVPELTSADYQPGSMTPLIEAATKTINALSKAIAKKDNKPKVVVCIQTDGEENCSTSEYTWASLKSLIEEKKKEGWQFTFLGAGIDAYNQGSKMGIGTANTMSYNHTNLRATKAAFAASAENTVAFASGIRSSTSYGASQKLAAEDAFDPDNLSLEKVASIKTPSVVIPGTTWTTVLHPVNLSLDDHDLTIGKPKTTDDLVL